MLDSTGGGSTNANSAPIVVPDTKVTVKSGDTLSAIAKANDITLKELLAANPKFTTDPKYKGGNMIWSGTKVTIPGTGYTINTTPTPAKNVPTPTPTPTPDTTPTDTTTTDTTTDTTTTTTTTTILRPSLIPSAPSTIPSTPIPPPAPTPPPPPIKTATPDIILFDNSAVPIEVMTDLIFENIGGQELLSIARNDTINGQDVLYQPIKNLSTIQQAYNPNNILNLQQTSEKYFQGYPIKLEEKIPNVGNGPNGENIYIDPTTGDLIIELVNMLQGEQVESQISINGTIYEGNI
jgi:hypothetical protein